MRSTEPTAAARGPLVEHVQLNARDATKWFAQTKAPCPSGKVSRSRNLSSRSRRRWLAPTRLSRLRSESLDSSYATGYGTSGSVAWARARR